MGLWEKVIHWNECPICKKAKTSFWTFALVYVQAVMIGFFVSGVVAMFSLYVMDYYIGAPLIQLPMIYTTAAYLGWIVWQGDKLICTCAKGV